MNDFLERLRTRAGERRRGRYIGGRIGKSLCFVQGDQNIANQAGAAFRSDLNAELQALVTNSQGASGPGTTYRNQFWHDTTANVIKRRNAANAAWIVMGTLDEAFVLSRSSNTILGLSDIGKEIVATSTFTQTLTAAATLGDGWYIDYRNDGTGVITLDPNSSETIDGATTLNLYPGESCRIWCNGSAFKTVGRAIAPRILAKSGVAVSAPADTSEDTLATITIPANAMGANGGVRIRFWGSVTSNANAKTLRARYSGGSGTIYLQIAAGGAAVASFMGDVTIMNRNATNSQTGIGTYGVTNTAGGSGGSTSAVDTTASSSIVLTGQKATAGDALTLDGYVCELITDGT